MWSVWKIKVNGPASSFSLVWWETGETHCVWYGQVSQEPRAEPCSPSVVRSSKHDKHSSFFHFQPGMAIWVIGKKNMTTCPFPSHLPCLNDQPHWKGPSGKKIKRWEKQIGCKATLWHGDERSKTECINSNRNHGIVNYFNNLKVCICTITMLTSYASCMLWDFWRIHVFSRVVLQRRFHWTVHLRMFAWCDLIGWRISRCLKTKTLLNFWMQETEPMIRTDPQCISVASHAKSMRSVDGRVQCARGLTSTRDLLCYVMV